MKTIIHSRARSVRPGTVIACATFVLLAPMAMAQDTSGDGPHPAHIHLGTCAQLGDVVAPLTDVAAVTGDGVGAATAIPAKTSRSFIDLPLQEIIDGGHAVNVHLSAEEIDEYIACGDIGGTLESEGDRQHLIIGLGEQTDSGHTGVAWLGSDGDRTEVVVTLTEPGDAQ